jgi:hypothetical protein
MDEPPVHQLQALLALIPPGLVLLGAVAARCPLAEEHAAERPQQGDHQGHHHELQQHT